MASTSEFEVTFEVVKKAAVSQGPTYAYRKGARKVRILAASAHPKDLLAVLNADITVNAGEVIEILAVHQESVGTEGAVVLS